MAMGASMKGSTSASSGLLVRWIVATLVALMSVSVLGPALLRTALPVAQAVINHSGAELVVLDLSLLEGQRERVVACLAQARAASDDEARRAAMQRSMVRIEWSAGQLLLAGGVAVLAALAWPVHSHLELLVRAGLVGALSAIWTVLEVWGLVGGQLREMLGDRADPGWLAPVGARIVIDSGGLIPAGLLIAAIAVVLAPRIARRCSRWPQRHRSGSFMPAPMALAVMVALAAVAVVPQPAMAIMAGLSPDQPVSRIDPNLETSKWAGVGSVLYDANPYSGTVISPRLILTAAHAVGDRDPARIRFQLNLNGTPYITQASSVQVHPDFVNAGAVKGDLAVIVLAADLPQSVPIYTLNRAAPIAGTDITLVGYGRSCRADGFGCVDPSASVKRSGRNIADLFYLPIAPIDQSLVGKMFLYDFDATGVQSLTGGQSLGNTIETSSASGDSGGPAFLTASSPPVLYGINTIQIGVAGRQVSTAGTLGGGVLVSAYADWIDGVIANNPSVPSTGEVPLPPWVYGALAAAFLMRLRSIKSPGSAPS